MDRYFADDGSSGETPIERSGRYWKHAAKAYGQACAVETAEAKRMYIQIAMAWASLANEMERAAAVPPYHGHEKRPQH